MADNPTDKLLRDLALKDSGWHRQEHPETGVSAYFPETAKDVEAWESRCQAMHKNQNPIVPEVKPVADGIRQIVRGD